MQMQRSLYHGHRFPAVVISQAVRWYFQCQLSLRDTEELLFERGAVVSYETIRRWCDKFGASFARSAKGARRKPGTQVPSPRQGCQYGKPNACRTAPGLPQPAPPLRLPWPARTVDNTSTAWICCRMRGEYRLDPDFAAVS
jgi:hypothetical protein